MDSGRRASPAARTFEIENEHGLRATVLEHGALLQSLWVPDATGAAANVVLGYSDPLEYLRDSLYLGATVGRFANRLRNGRFTIDGEEYRVPRNAYPHTVHGGGAGFNSKTWAGRPYSTSSGEGVSMRYVSADGEEGFPGTLRVEVRYEAATDDNTLRIVYSAITDRPTVVNLTNHSFFNLDGEGSGSILDHSLTLDADHFLPLDGEFIPTGEVRAVAATPMDFRHPRAIGQRISEADDQLRLAGGYDHNYVLRPADGLARAARLVAPVSGRTLEIWTTEPAIDVYTANAFDGSVTGAGGRPYLRFGGIALETEHVSNSPNVAGFPSTVLRPGDEYRSLTELRFGVSRPSAQAA